MIKLNIIFPNIRLTSFYPFNWNWNSVTLIKILIEWLLLNKLDPSLSHFIRYTTDGLIFPKILIKRLLTNS